MKVRGFRIELSELESALREQEGIKEAAAVVREESGNKRLVAYVVNGAEPINPLELKNRLKQRLPGYMLPAVIMQIERMPLTPNGKLDRKSLPAPDQISLTDHSYNSPVSHPERLLSRIWSEVLRVERIGVHDNFFELGGDSILSIQVVSRALQTGLKITPRQMFQSQTIAELAAVAVEVGESEASWETVSGPLPLTPIQEWFFAQQPSEPDHYNQAVMFELSRPMSLGELEEIIAALVDHHDALRTRFEQVGVQWRQEILAEESARVVTEVDLSGLGRERREEAIEAAADEAQRSLSLGAGPVMRAVLMRGGEWRRLLLIIHHLVVDGVSWRVLLEDLQILAGSGGEHVRLAGKTLSYQKWSETLKEREEAGEYESGYWAAILEEGRSKLPIDKPGGRNEERDRQTVSERLSAEETKRLLQDVVVSYRAQIQEVLLTALSEVVREWSGGVGVRVELEGHGREEIEEVDVARTVGWFTSVYGMVVGRGEGGAEIEEKLREVKEEVRRMPSQVTGYQVEKRKRWAEGSEEEREALESELVFNYLGQFDQAVREEAGMRIARERMGRVRSEHGRRSHKLEISGLVMGGELRLDWSYSERQYERSTIERLAKRYVEALKGMIRESVNVSTAEYSLSEFTEFNWSQEDLNEIVAEIKKSIK